MRSRGTERELQSALAVLIEDVLQQSDQEIIAEAEEAGDIAELDAKAFHAITAAHEAHGRNKLALARAQLVKKRATPEFSLSVEVSRARHVFNRLIAQDRGLALAARNGAELSDDQIAQILRDWLNLGAVSQADFD